MILDIITNCKRYINLHSSFEQAFEFLKRNDLAELPEGKYEIDEENIYAIVAKDAGRQPEEAQLETHQKYIDIQMILAGTDNMGWKPKVDCLHPATKYDEIADIQFFSDKPNTFLRVKENSFAIFFPKDAHLPLISNEIIHKVVVKIAVD